MLHRGALAAMGTRFEIVAGGADLRLLRAAVEQAFEGPGLDQRHVTVEHQHLAIAEAIQRLGYRMPGALLLGLLAEGEFAIVGCRPGFRQRLAHRLATVADHYMQPGALQPRGGIDDVLNQGTARQLVQHLRCLRAHAGTLAGGQNHDVEGHGVSPSLFNGNRASF